MSDNKYIFRFDFDCDTWITGLEIEANSLDEAKDKLRGMSLADIAEYGFEKEKEIKDLDYQVKINDYSTFFDNKVSELIKKAIADSDDESVKDLFVSSISISEDGSTYEASFKIEDEHNNYDYCSFDFDVDLENDSIKPFDDIIEVIKKSDLFN